MRLHTRPHAYTRPHATLRPHRTALWANFDLTSYEFPSRLCLKSECLAVFKSGNGRDVRHAVCWEQSSTTSNVPGLRRQGIPDQLSGCIGNAIILYLRDKKWAPMARLGSTQR